MAKNSTGNQGNGASPQIFQVNALGLGKRKPVRQLKKTGGLLVRKK